MECGFVQQRPTSSFPHFKLRQVQGHQKHSQDQYKEKPFHRPHKACYFLQIESIQSEDV